MGGGAGLVGELAGVADLRASTVRRMVNLSAACENVVAVLCAALIAPGQGVVPRNGGERRRGGSRRPRPNWRRAQLADHG